MVLYGSRARDQAREASDWDLFIIATDLSMRPWERHITLKRSLPAPFHGAVSLLAKTPQKFEEKISFLYLDIAQDGQILFDPHGYAHPRSAVLQRLMAEMGLYRKKSLRGGTEKPIKPSPPRILPEGGWKATANTISSGNANSRIPDAKLIQAKRPIARAAAPDRPRMHGSKTLF